MWTEECKDSVIHQDVVDHVASKMPGEWVMEEMAGAFKIFGDFTRIRILYSLSMNELCVCDLAALLSMTQSAISHQLRVLKQARLVRSRKEGKVVYYSLDDGHIRTILSQGFVHVMEMHPIQKGGDYHAE